MMHQGDAPIVKKEQLCEDIVRLTLLAPEIATTAQPGQFINVKTSINTLDPLLRRPFSIHQTDQDGTLQIVFKILGKGTTALARAKVLDSVNIVGPLGNNYTLSDTMCLIGGGLGIAPIAFLAKTALRSPVTKRLIVILGARTKSELLPFVEDFSQMGITPLLATNDGTLGHHGLVTDLIAQLPQESSWQIQTCGPYPMMKAIAGHCRTKGWSCQVSLETMMACGIKACLGCTVAAASTHSKGVKYLHVCQDGPVFAEGDIAWK